MVIDRGHHELHGKGTNGSVRKGAREAERALKKTWPYVLLGLFIGGGLLALQEYLIHLEHHPPELATKLIEHLGVGFLVSAIAVFFYEWGSHAKEMRELNEKLLAWEYGQPEENLRKAIRRLFGEEEGRELPIQVEKLFLYCHNLIINISKLLEIQEWAKDKYLNFFSDSGS